MKIRDVTALLENHKADMQEFMSRWCEEINTNLKKYDQSFLEIQKDSKKIIKQYSYWDDYIQKTKFQLNRTELKINDMEELFEKIKPMRTWDGRILQCENTIRQCNRLMNDLVLQTHQDLSKAMFQRNTEETVLKYMFSMLDNVFGNDGIGNEADRNMDLQSQLKISFSRWKADIKEQFDLGNFTEEPAQFSLFGLIPLKKPGELRKHQLYFELNKTEINKKGKIDDFGRRRRNSFDHKKGILKTNVQSLLAGISLEPADDKRVFELPDERMISPKENDRAGN